MNIIKIGSIEIGDSFGGQYYFPYSLGILQTYAKRNLSNPEDYEFSDILYKRSQVEDWIERLASMDVVFFSVYLWNFKVSLEIAQKIKYISRTVVTVFGGPQIPEKPARMSEFLHAYPFVDIACFGEGEATFLALLRSYPDMKRDHIPSIGYIAKDGTFRINSTKESIADINDIPSPYLEGAFDGLIRNNPEEKWQGLLETNRGCPFTCAYCYWGKKDERKVKNFEIDRVYREIEWLSKNRVEFIFCCDANFGIFPRDLDIARKAADNKKRLGYPRAFSVQNTKNSRERIFELQKTLNDAGLQKGVNLALQSLHQDTLKYIGRNNIDNKTYHELQQLFSSNNIQTFTDLIMGLPGETYNSFTKGVSDLLGMGQHNRIQFINLTILENTLMADPEYLRRYGLKMVESAFIPHHSSLDSLHSIKETQFLVVGSNVLCQNDWIRIRVFSWITSLLHFNKLLQIPFIVLHVAYGISYRNLIDLFTEKDAEHPILTNLVSLFEEKAHQILAGDSEYSPSREYLNITWYPDELALIALSTQGKLTDFYHEAENKMNRLAVDSVKVPADVISQSIALNLSLMKQPFMMDDGIVTCDYNIWEVYQSGLKGNGIELKKGAFIYTIDRTSQTWKSWDDWCRDVIWYGNKKGDYIYPLKK